MKFVCDSVFLWSAQMLAIPLVFRSAIAFDKGRYLILIDFAQLTDSISVVFSARYTIFVLTREAWLNHLSEVSVNTNRRC